MITPSVFDLFRVPPQSDFATSPRLLDTGQNASIQVFHDGVFDASPFNGSVDLNEDTFVNAADVLGTGDIPLATGRLMGDSDRASSYKADARDGVTVTGITLGVFDPRLDPGEIGVVSAIDIRVLGLLAYDVSGQ